MKPRPRDGSRLALGTMATPALAKDRSPAWRSARGAAVLLACALAANAQVATVPGGLAVSPLAFSTLPLGAVKTGWRFTGLPAQKVAATRFDIIEHGNRRVLRVQADASYGALLWEAGAARLGQGSLLRWSWQLERGLAQSDLSRKEGDDSPLKVCALFDMPLDGLPFGERAKLRMARLLSGQALPSATLCYVWDRLLPEGTLIDNPYSRRVRIIVVSSGAARPGQWFGQERNLTQDFARAFGQESPALPPLSALLIGADADNTLGSSLGFVGDVTLEP